MHLYLYNADRAENQNLVSALSITINKILCQFFEFTQNVKRSRAIAYSFAEMASAHHLNVYKYIKYLLDQRPNDQMEDTQLEAMSHRMKT